MGVGVLKRIAVGALLASTPLALSAQTDLQMPLRKVEIHKLSCEEVAALARPDVREKILIYMNGYLDGTVKATTWDVELVGKRIDEVVRVCTANPKSTLHATFKQAWSR